ncbi:uncharacterized protein [Prorops nasuta]|uniref:uncharacterized protein n=1 Tax=Prorops nasuta TaxID=863751 RepID=UPI0034CDCB9F
MEIKKCLAVYYEDGYVYHKSKSYVKVNGESVIYLKCNVEGCRGTAKLINNMFNSGTIHSHEKPLDYKLLAEFRKSIYDTVEIMPSTSKQAYNICAKKHPMAAQKISFPEIKRSINKWKRKRFPASPKTIKDCSKVLNNNKWRNFLTFSEGEEKYEIETLQYTEGSYTAIIFYDKNLCSTLSECKTISLDGTFKTVPLKDATQIITIMGKIKDKFFPFLWILLDTKKQEFYISVFKFIKSEILPDFKPEICITDFEKGLQNAIAVTFCSVKMQGCYFHYVYRVRKQIKKLKIFTKVKEANINLASRVFLFIRKLYNLPYLPPKYIKTGFLLIKMEIECNHDLEILFRKLLKYIFNQWILKTDPNILSIYRAADTTNNAQERYHRTINTLLGARPPLSKFFFSTSEI